MPCPPPPKKNNLKQKQYCNKVNTKPLKMVHIKKKKNRYQSLIRITTLYYLNPQPPQTASHSLKTVYTSTPPCVDSILLPYPLSEVKSLSRVRLFATAWTVGYQVPPSMGFSRQEYWSGLPFPSPTLSSRVTLITTTLTLIPETMLILLLFALL